jgi:hypothetical protein
MDAFARVAARYGVDPADANAVDRFFAEWFPSLDEATRDRIFEDILAAEAPAAAAVDPKHGLSAYELHLMAHDQRRHLSDGARRALGRVSRGQNPELDRLLERLDQIIRAAAMGGEDVLQAVQSYRGVRED